MAKMSAKRRGALAGVLLLPSLWAVAYFLWPRYSFDDGPFLAESCTADVSGLPVLSSVDLKLAGTTLFVLETRASGSLEPRAVFVLKDSAGAVRWAKAAAVEFGPIHLVEDSTRWYGPGGWVVRIRPERTESGDLYLSAFGNFRFFFHSW